MKILREKKVRIYFTMLTFFFTKFQNNGLIRLYNSSHYESQQKWNITVNGINELYEKSVIIQKLIQLFEKKLHNLIKIKYLEFLRN